MSKVSESPAFRRPTAAGDRANTAAAKADPDDLPLTANQLKAMLPLRTLRGRPRSDSAKYRVSVPYSQEDLAHFRSTGEGWQSRMDSVLRDHVNKQSR